MTKAKIVVVFACFKCQKHCERAYEMESSIGEFHINADAHRTETFGRDWPGEIEARVLSRLHPEGFIIGGADLSQLVALARNKGTAPTEASSESDAVTLTADGEPLTLERECWCPECFAEITAYLRRQK